jgi:hypothetical protein
MVRNVTDTNKTNNYLTPKIIEHRKATIYEVGNPGPGLWYAQKCGGAKPVYEISILLLIFESSTDIRRAWGYQMGNKKKR